MKRYLLAMVIGLAGMVNVYGQTEFQRTYGGLKKENSYHVLPAKGGTIFSVGSTESFGKGASDIYVMKTDSIGNLLWAKSYGSAKDDYGTYIEKTTDGNYVVLGYSFGLNANYTGAFSDICLMKINENGDVIWSKSYGLDKSEYSTSLKPTADGGFIILGEMINFIGNDKNADILVIKVNAQGVIEWSKVCGGNNTDYGYSIQELRTGGYIIGGETNSYGSGSWDFYLVKLEKDGQVAWSKTYGSNTNDYGRFAIECPDGGFIVGGNTAGFDAQGLDFCLVKTDASGAVQWSKVYGGNGTDYLLYMKVVNSTSFAFTGYTNSTPAVSEDACVVLLDFTGKPLWAKLFGSDLHDSGVSLNLTSSKKELIMGGSTNGFGTKGEDVLLIRMPLTLRSLPCNKNSFYPFNTRKVEVSSKTGHYEYDLHCDVTSVTLGVTNTVSAEQIICNTSMGNY